MASDKMDTNRTNQAKGNDLESAVAMIERVILGESENFKEKTFLIESKKILVVNGVRNEIDVWVEVFIASGYSPVYIFECKNWENKVGKNEIIIFSEKIKISGAAKGYFVAKSFTSDALSQAKLDPRMSLLFAEEVFLTTPASLWFKMICRQKPYRGVLLMRPRGAKGETPVAMTPKQVFLNGEEIHASTYFEKLTLEIIDKLFLQFDGDDANPGVYEGTGAGCVSYELGELIVDGKDIETISIEVFFNIKVVVPIIRSYFDIKTRGRLHIGENIDVDGCPLGIGIVFKS